MTNTRPERLLIPAVVAGVAWWYLLHGAGLPPAMPGMDMPASLAALVVMWTAMMAAMMLPGAAPWIAARGTRFATGYLLVWTAFGAAAALMQWELQRAGALSDAMALRSAPVAALLVAVAGIYEFMPLKAACLRRCRPGRSTQEATGGAGFVGAIRGGVRQGVSCVGCCWLLMALLFVTGVMNVTWMVAITLVVVAEKLLPFRVHVERVAGTALVLCAAVVAGAAVPGHP